MSNSIECLELVNGYDCEHVSLRYVMLAKMLLGWWRYVTVHFIPLNTFEMIDARRFW